MSAPEVDHMAITVADLDDSVAFYESMLGFVVVDTADAEGEVVEDAVGVAGSAMRIALLEAGNLKLELIEYVRGGGERAAPAMNDVGAAHLCIAVPDIESAHAELVRKGAEFVSAPSRPLNAEGTRIAFLRDPDGVCVELLQERS